MPAPSGTCPPVPALADRGIAVVTEVVRVSVDDSSDSTTSDVVVRFDHPADDPTVTETEITYYDDFEADFPDAEKEGVRIEFDPEHPERPRIEDESHNRAAKLGVRTGRDRLRRRGGRDLPRRGTGLSGRTILTVAKKVDDESDEEEEEAEARPEEADTFGSGEPLASVASFTGADVETDDEASAPDAASDSSGPLDSDDRAATGSEADDADHEEPPPLQDLVDADADEMEAEDLGGLDA